VSAHQVISLEFSFQGVKELVQVKIFSCNAALTCWVCFWLGLFLLGIDLFPRLDLYNGFLGRICERWIDGHVCPYCDLLGICWILSLAPAFREVSVAYYERRGKQEFGSLFNSCEGCFASAACSGNCCSILGQFFSSSTFQLVSTNNICR